MEDGKQCGTCKHHWKHIPGGPDDRFRDEWWCSNEEADAYGAYTQFSDGCPDWEEGSGYGH